MVISKGEDPHRTYSNKQACPAPKTAASGTNLHN